MEDKIQRRAFLSKLTLGLGSLAALPLAGNSNPPTTDIQTPMAIKRIRPLGFQWDTADPFLFCVHHEDYFPKGNAQMGPSTSLAGRHLGQDFIVRDGFRMYHGTTVPGFPGHPHRGFETITVVRKGLVDHADSTGAAGRYGNGDVQWMTAGRGVQHSEMFPLLREDADNPVELFQIWLNLPSKNKMVAPHFKMIWAEEVPKIDYQDLNGKSTLVEALVGKLGRSSSPTPPPDSWAFDPQNEVAIYNIIMQPGAQWTLPAASKGINRTLYYYEGSGLKVDNTIIPPYHGADATDSIDILLQNGDEPSKVLVLQGRPIQEPVVQHGPFVMNTRDEIRQAFDDYQRTQFGGWPWPRYDQVHPRDTGRFALHSDGRQEIPG